MKHKFFNKNLIKLNTYDNKLSVCSQLKKKKIPMDFSRSKTFWRNGF